MNISKEYLKEEIKKYMLNKSIDNPYVKGGAVLNAHIEELCKEDQSFLIDVLRECKEFVDKEMKYKQTSDIKKSIDSRYDFLVKLTEFESGRETSNAEFLKSVLEEKNYSEKCKKVLESEKSGALDVSKEDLLKIKQSLFTEGMKTLGDLTNELVNEGEKVSFFTKSKEKMGLSVKKTLNSKHVVASLPEKVNSKVKKVLGGMWFGAKVAKMGVKDIAKNIAVGVKNWYEQAKETIHKEQELRLSERQLEQEAGLDTMEIEQEVVIDERTLVLDGDELSLEENLIPDEKEVVLDKQEVVLDKVESMESIDLTNKEVLSIEDKPYISMEKLENDMNDYGFDRESLSSKIKSMESGSLSKEEVESLDGVYCNYKNLMTIKATEFYKKDLENIESKRKDAFALIENVWNIEIKKICEEVENAWADKFKEIEKEIEVLFQQAVEGKSEREKEFIVLKKETALGENKLRLEAASAFDKKRLIGAQKEFFMTKKEDVDVLYESDMREVKSKIEKMVFVEMEKLSSEIDKSFTVEDLGNEAISKEQSHIKQEEIVVSEKVEQEKVEQEKVEKKEESVYLRLKNIDTCTAEELESRSNEVVLEKARIEKIVSELVAGEWVKSPQKEEYNKKMVELQKYQDELKNLNSLKVEIMAKEIGVELRVEEEVEHGSRAWEDELAKGYF